VYGNHKADWLHHNTANVEWGGLLSRVRGAHADGRYVDAVEHVTDVVKGLSWTKAGFALAMCGVWEVACPDTRTKQMCGIEGRVRTRADYEDALAAIDDSFTADVPTFVKQWVLYDRKGGEHARHMAFFKEINPYL
jgi:hypothetical protein